MCEWVDAGCYLKAHSYLTKGSESSKMWQEGEERKPGSLKASRRYLQGESSKRFLPRVFSITKGHGACSLLWHILWDFFLSSSSGQGAEGVGLPLPTPGLLRRARGEGVGMQMVPHHLLLSFFGDVDDKVPGGLHELVPYIRAVSHTTAGMTLPRSHCRTCLQRRRWASNCPGSSLSLPGPLVWSHAPLGLSPTWVQFTFAPEPRQELK